MVLNLIYINSSEVRVVFGSFEVPEFSGVEIIEEFRHSGLCEGL